MGVSDEAEHFPERRVVETALGDREAAVAREVLRVEAEPRHVQAHDARDAGEPALQGDPVAEGQGIEIEMDAPAHDAQLQKHLSLQIDTPSGHRERRRRVSHLHITDAQLTCSEKTRGGDRMQKGQSAGRDLRSVQSKIEPTYRDALAWTAGVPQADRSVTDHELRRCHRQLWRRRLRRGPLLGFSGGRERRAGVTGT